MKELPFSVTISPILWILLGFPSGSRNWTRRN